jgi:hypothetical protein
MVLRMTKKNRFFVEGRAGCHSHMARPDLIRGLAPTYTFLW